MITIYTVIIALGLISGFILFSNIKYCIADVSENLEQIKLSLIIPARNEQDNLEKLLASITPQKYQPLEIIVIDDNSTDNTNEIAIKYGAKVFKAGDLPLGWTGKNWACHQGSKKAEGEILFFLDADTFFEKDGLAAIACTYNKCRGAVSIAPYHFTKKLHEQFSSFFNIITFLSMNAFSIFTKRYGVMGLFGPSLIVSKSDYFKIGGHECVKGKILENFFMASHFIDKGISLNCFAGKGCLCYRMYHESFISMFNGWSKAFASGAKSTAKIPLILIFIWISGLFSIISGLITGIEFNHSFILITAMSAYIISIFQIRILLSIIGKFSWLTSMFFPIFLVFFVYLMTHSAIKKKFNKGDTVWRDRVVKT